MTGYGTVAGGSEQWLLSALRHSPQLRIRAIVLQPGPLADALSGLGASVTVIPTGTDTKAMLGAAKEIETLLRRDRPDVVLGNGVKAMLAVIGPARLLGLPTVWVKHDHSYDSIAPLLGRLVSKVVPTAAEVGKPTKRFDAVVIEPERPPTPLSREAARDEFARLSGRPLASGPTSESSAGPASEHPSDTSDSPVLAMIGRLVPYKGVDVAIGALAYPPARRWRLVVIGADDVATPGESVRLRALAEQLGVADRVLFAGGLPGAGSLLAAFDALAVLTRPGQPGAPTKEGFGITATEAMLAGIPVIVAGEGPVARRLATPDGPAGMVVRPGDALACAEALAALSDPRVRQEFGARGRVAALEQPDAQAVADRLAAVLADMAGRGA